MFPPFRFRLGFSAMDVKQWIDSEESSHRLGRRIGYSGWLEFEILAGIPRDRAAHQPAGPHIAHIYSSGEMVWW